MAVEIIAERKTGVRRVGEGAPAVMLHCSLAHSGAWSGISAGLADRLSMTAIDLPGHGDTEFDPALDMQAQSCETAIAVLDSLDEPAHLIGHSFGATVALRCAIMRPDLVASLTMYEPVYFALLASGDPAAYEAEMAASAEFTKYTAAQDWSNAVVTFMERWGSDGGFAAMPEGQQKYVLKTIPMIVENSRSVLVYREGGVTLADVADVKVPCLLMDGGRSPEVIHRLNDLLEATLPNVERQVFQTAAHMGPISHAPEVGRAVRTFLFGDEA